MHPQLERLALGEVAGPFIIGLVGYAGSGKTTLARHFASTHSHGTERIGFADPIGHMLAAFGVPRDVLEDKARWSEPRPELNGETVRHAALTLGTNWGRVCFPAQPMTIWTRHAIRRAKEWDGLTIIDNVRFPDEARAIIENGGELVAIKSPDAPVVVNRKEHSESFVPLLQSRCARTVINERGHLADAHHRFAHAIAAILEARETAHND